MRKKNVIVAPHMDDELIGCWEIIRICPSNCYILFTNPSLDFLPKNYKKDEWLKGWGVNYLFMFPTSIPKSLLNDRYRFYFPDPIYEFHPDHRKQGAIGEELLRKGYDVIFYNVNMQAPYIHEVKDSHIKRSWLNNSYPEKEDLWKYDHKYFLFEGRCKWML